MLPVTATQNVLTNLFDIGVSVDCKNNAGDNPIDMARQGRNMRIAKKLQKAMDLNSNRASVRSATVEDDFLDTEIASFDAMAVSYQNRQINTMPLSLPSIHSDQYMSPPVSESIGSSNRWSKALEDIKYKCEPAYQFWIDSL